MQLAFSLGANRLGLLAPLETRVTGSKLVLEFLDTTGRINKLQLTRVKRMTSVTNIDLQFGPSAARGKGIPATAFHGGDEILGMDFLFHDRQP
jgi:hypothetical protein